MHMKISSAEWRPFCLGGDELKKVHAIEYHCENKDELILQASES